MLRVLQKWRTLSISFYQFSSLLPGLKLELPIFTTALPVPGHERVNTYCYNSCYKLVSKGNEKQNILKRYIFAVGNNTALCLYLNF